MLRTSCSSWLRSSSPPPMERTARMRVISSQKDCEGHWRIFALRRLGASRCRPASRGTSVLVSSMQALADMYSCFALRDLLNDVASRDGCRAPRREPGWRTRWASSKRSLLNWSMAALSRRARRSRASRSDCSSCLASSIEGLAGRAAASCSCLGLRLHALELGEARTAPRRRARRARRRHPSARSARWSR